ncbi:classical arabinogalactan protein 26 [Magnolia sinica]|uniref:classical arabinogalactan protein 26 n=1 Tax=Magnolia sinica TaxID=86752 RepID=UPI00265A53F6|nr:classical arabinogalactan protein 26 [Magnolia sinica]
MASFSFHTIKILLSMAVILTVIPQSLSFPSKLEISTISAAPATLPNAPVSSPPYLAPDITPLLPSTGGIGPSPSSGGDGGLPTIPSNPSPPNPDEVAASGPNSAISPSGSFSAMASTTSGSAPGCSAAAAYAGVMLFCFLHLIGSN